MLVPSSHPLSGGIQPHPGHPLAFLWGHTVIQEPPSAQVRSTDIGHSQDKLQGGSRVVKAIGEGLGVCSGRRKQEGLCSPAPRKVLGCAQAAGLLAAPGSGNKGTRGPSPRPEPLGAAVCHHSRAAVQTGSLGKLPFLNQMSPLP